MVEIGCQNEPVPNTLALIIQAENNFDKSWFSIDHIAIVDIFSTTSHPLSRESKFYKDLSTSKYPKRTEG